MFKLFMWNRTGLYQIDFVDVLKRRQFQSKQRADTQEPLEHQNGKTDGFEECGFMLLTRRESTIEIDSLLQYSLRKTK